MFFQVNFKESGTANIVEVRRTILQCQGPLISVRDAVFLFSSNKRPTAETVKAVMKSFEKDDMGTLIQVQKSTVFLKALPDVVKGETLEMYNVTKECYTDEFFKVPSDEKRVENIRRFLEQHPEKDKIRADMFPPNEEA